MGIQLHPKYGQQEPAALWGKPEQNRTRGAGNTYRTAGVPVRLGPSREGWREAVLPVGSGSRCCGSGEAAGIKLEGEGLAGRWRGDQEVSAGSTGKKLGSGDRYLFRLQAPPPPNEQFSGRYYHTLVPRSGH